MSEQNPTTTCPSCEVWRERALKQAQRADQAEDQLLDLVEMIGERSGGDDPLDDRIFCENCTASGWPEDGFVKGPVIYDGVNDGQRLSFCPEHWARLEADEDEGDSRS